MKMNVLKRGAALGALMAFVITGSAMAATIEIDGEKTKVDLFSSFDIGNNDSIIKSGAGIQLDTNEDGIMNGKEIHFTLSSSAIYAKGGATVTVGNSNTDKLYFKSTASGSQKPCIWGTSNSKIVLDAKDIRVESNRSSAIEVNGGQLSLGSSNTQLLTVESNKADQVILITQSNSKAKFEAKEIVINAKAEGARGIVVNNSTTDAKDNMAKLDIIADKTTINAHSAIVAFSQGQININSDLITNGENAIVARGNASIKVNEDGNHRTQLNGDISFAYSSDSGTGVDANVVVNLTGADSYWNGNTKVVWDAGSLDEVKDKLDVNGLKVSLNYGAQWNPDAVTNSGIDADGNVTDANGTKYVALNNLKSDGGVINLEKMGNQTLQVENLSGKDLTVNVAADDNKMAITKENKVENLTVGATQEYSEKLVEGNIKDGLNSLANVVVDKNGTSAADTVKIEETGVLGEITAELDNSGKLVESSIKEKLNTGNAGIISMASIALLTWRQENNDMNKRLGELRDSKGEVGIWTRMTRGESEFKSVKNQYNSYQIGYDEKLNDNWIMGGAVTYTEGKSSFAGGNGENKHKGFSGYLSYLGDDGSFVDLIAKYAWLDHDFETVRGAGSGNYDTNGYSLSAEYGKRFTKENGYWIEPQVELTYGKVDSASYMGSNKVSIHQSDMESLVGRVGFAMGKNIKHGNVYVRASYLYDFDGETSVTFVDSNNCKTIEQDLGGGWFEVGVGTNINLSDTSHMYFDVEKTYGGDTATPWQWNAGVRFSF